ncbi:catabolic L-serine/threonine dehydratase [Coemansia sp. BCRC 34301]|nr:catabolic L-serine/threonine dehydratase [Coemansia sp. BCRC 34301]
MAMNLAHSSSSSKVWTLRLKIYYLDLALSSFESKAALLDTDRAEAAKEALRINGERSALIVTQRAHKCEAAVAKQAILDHRASYSHKHIYMVLPLAQLAADSGQTLLHIPTPLLYSASMSKLAGCNVWLKLENMQPTQSFKIRGLGNTCVKAALEQEARQFVTVGDSNAALAVAYSGRRLGVPVTVFVASSAQASAVRAKIELEGANIQEGGRTIKDAYEAACAFVRQTDGAVMVDKADDSAAIAGNATIVPEINVQLQRQAPAAIVTTVGSGGLLSGLITGLNRCQWQQVPVIAVETHNTNSFQQALLCGSTHSSDSETAADVGSDGPLDQIKSLAAPSLLPPLDEDDVDVDAKLGLGGKAMLARSDSENVTMYLSRVRLSSDATRTAGEPTVATCLQSGSVCPSALELARAHPVVPVSVSEAMAVEACRRFLDDHQLLIEIGSAAALSVVGKGLVRQIIPDLASDDHIVVIVTGGANISLDRLDSCRQRFPYPAPIIAKSGHEIFMRMSESTLSATGGGGGGTPSSGAVSSSATLPHSVATMATTTASSSASSAPFRPILPAAPTTTTATSLLVSGQR